MLDIQSLIAEGVVDIFDLQSEVNFGTPNMDVISGVVDVWNGIEYDDVDTCEMLPLLGDLQSNLLRRGQVNRNSYRYEELDLAYRIACNARNMAIVSHYKKYNFSEASIDELGGDMLRLMSAKGADYGQSVYRMLPTSILDVMANKVRRIASITYTGRQAVKPDAIHDEYFDILGYSIYLSPS